MKKFQSKTLADMMGELCPAVGVEIHVIEDSESNVVIRNWETEDAKIWLRRIQRKGIEIPSLISDNIQLLKVIKSGARTVGRAALNPTDINLGIYSIHGFSSFARDFFDNRTGQFFGVLDQVPVNPRRDDGALIDEEAVRAWVDNQLELWATINLQPRQRHCLAKCAAAFEVSAPDFANVLVNDVWVDLKDFCVKLCQGEVFAFPLSQIKAEEYRVDDGLYDDFETFEFDFESFEDIIFSDYSSFDDSYWYVSPLECKFKYGFIGMLRGEFEKNEKFRLELEFKDIVAGRYTGDDRPDLHLKSGDDITRYAVEVSAVRRR